MHRTGWLLLLSVLAVAGSACARRTGAAPEGGLRSADSTAYLEVTNTQAAPIEIFAIAAGASHRMGQVEAGLSRRYAIPRMFVGSGGVEFVTQAFGAVTVRTGRLNLFPGQVVEFSVGVNQAASSVWVRRP